MAIIRFDINSKSNPREKEYAEGAYCQLPSKFSSEFSKEDDKVLILWETHQGLCLRDEEENRYDDSDFYMTVWDPELKKPERILYASTRGWTYPSMGSRVDATPEVRAEYEAWKVATARRNRITSKLAVRRQRIELGKDIGFDQFAIKALEAHFGSLDSWYAGRFDRLWARNRYGAKYNEHEPQILRITQLLKSYRQKRLRSPFKISLAQQLIGWLMLKDFLGEYPKFTPLSEKQRLYL